MRFFLDTSSGVPVYRQLIEQVENAVVSGRLKSGDRLPTIRSLSVELKINPNTIAKVYNELEIRGILKTQVGSGTFISQASPDNDNDRREKKISSILGRFFREMNELGVKKQELVKFIEEFQKTENRKQKTENRKQKTENRKQKTENNKEL
ncbi:MAG: GntR family transcriptional regulator [Spirochaetaceae bacterium]|nr:GntR family transcriptional regulator [Spirochaetaceae bacterium]